MISLRYQCSHINTHEKKTECLDQMWLVLHLLAGTASSLITRAGPQADSATHL